MLENNSFDVHSSKHLHLKNNRPQKEWFLEVKVICVGRYHLSTCNKTTMVSLLSSWSKFEIFIFICVSFTRIEDCIASRSQYNKYITVVFISGLL